MGDEQLAEVLRFPQTDNTGLQDEILAAAAAIQSVHRVPDLPLLDVYFPDTPRFGGYIPASEDRLRRIEVSSIGLTPRLTAVHEFGHFLDDALGGFEVYSSQEENSPLSRLVGVAESTQAINALREYEQQTRGTFSPERAQVTNRLEQVEIWARAYAQYIALRSQDVQLLAELQTRRDIEVGVLKNEQWEWEDFHPVALAIDALMQQLGWRL